MIAAPSSMENPRAGDCSGAGTKVAHNVVTISPEANNKRTSSITKHPHGRRVFTGSVLGPNKVDE